MVMAFTKELGLDQSITNGTILNLSHISVCYNEGVKQQKEYIATAEQQKDCTVTENGNRKNKFKIHCKR